MRRRAFIMVALAILTTIGTGACSDCIADCGAPAEELAFTGTLVAVDGTDTVWEGPDGRLEITVAHNVAFLDTGTRYQVSASREFASWRWRTAVNDDCTCGNIRHEDGAAIDTGWWTGFNRRYPVTEAVWLFLAIPVATMLAVTVNRIRRGGDFDPYGHLPDDGSWVEFDDEPSTR